MSGVLIYRENDLKRNKFAADKYVKELGVRIETPDYSGGADFVINRTNDFKIAEKFEKAGVRVFNSSALSRIANDKQRCYELMIKNGVPVMPINYDKVPAVKKPTFGSGGKDVTIINEREPFQPGFVYQKLCDTPGKDVRIWVIGGKIRAAFLRQNDWDFRSNFCLGGKAMKYNLSPDEISIANKVISLVKSDYIGVDFIFDKGKFVFNEIEDTVGARIFYSYSNIDIIAEYCDYIKKQM